MRACVTISPLSRTEVSPSSSNTTALTSSAYFFCGCWARLRSQSGVPATANAELKLKTSATQIVLIVLLGMDSASLQHRLLFVAGLHLAEETFDLRVHLQR